MTMTKTLLTISHLRGLGGVPSSKPAAIEWVRRQGLETHEISVRGGTALAVAFEALPEAVQVAYLQNVAGVQPEDDPDSGAWSAFVRKSVTVRADAEAALRALEAVEAKVAGGMGVDAAIRAVVTETTGFSVSGLYRKRSAVKGLPRANWLPALAANYKAGGREAEISDDAWRYFLTFLANSSGRLPLSTAYRKTKEASDVLGWEWPSYGTVRNRWNTLSAGERALIKSGSKALDETIPPQRRSIGHLKALQIVNLDGQQRDVRAIWEDGEVSRPILLAIQDVFSRAYLAWELVKTENSDATKRLILKVIDKYGIFDELVTDNSRAFASKKISGGARNRFRWKVEDDEALGILPMLGIKVQFTLPAHGQSKPIERGFRDFAEQIDTLPELKEGYCGHKPDAKPEGYSGRAVPIETIRKVYDREIRDHNERKGRRSEATAGKLSYYQAFLDDYKTRPHRHLTPAQRLFFMYDIADLKPNKKTGALSSKGFIWWDASHRDTLLQYANQKVRVLFDPEDRSRPVMVCDEAGRVIIENLPCMKAAKFDSTEDAREHHRLKHRIKKRDRESLRDRKLMTRKEMDAIEKRARAAKGKPVEPVSETNISQPVFGVPVGRATQAAATKGATISKLRGDEDSQSRFSAGLAKLREEKKAMG